jgi:hypothetical protein
MTFTYRKEVVRIEPVFAVYLNGEYLGSVASQEYAEKYAKAFIDATLQVSHVHLLDGRKAPRTSAALG